MDLSLVISQSTDIRATPARVWEGLTNPVHIRGYLYGAETIASWEKGTEVIFQGEFDGKSYRDKGEVLENDPEKTLSYTYWSGFSGMEDVPENYSVVTYHVKPIDEETTRLTWTQRGFATKEAHEHSAKGMSVFLNSVKEVIEKI